MDTNEVSDLSFLRELAMGDESIIIETTETFLGNAPATIENIEKAYHEGDWKELYKQAHKIKPSLKYMGMEKAHDLIIHIEEQAMNENISDQLESQTTEFIALCEQALTELSVKVESLKE